MTQEKNWLKGKRVLAVDDEKDVLETIVDILEEARVDTAQDYGSASEKIQNVRYDLAVLDIMGVDGLKLLEQTVERGIPTVMLTAHAVNPEALMESIRKGAVSYLPKETMAELDVLLNDLLAAYERGEPPWKRLFERLGSYFDERFGPGWRQKEKTFWSEFDVTYQVGKGIQERLKRDRRFMDKV
ncbi:MAG: response regulator [Deltaproteobacteria bacterium]|nr:response regulator [Deltaproteobacteria bacterium]MBW2133461.1 response regulator [Deltaproteobacteria bacterium]